MSNQQKWSLDSLEIGKSCGINIGKVYKVYVAKILPLVTFGKPKSKIVALSKNCFINANDCKPSISTKVKIINYIKIPLSASATLKSSTKIKHGTSLKISVKHSNPDELTVLSKKDKVIK